MKKFLLLFFLFASLTCWAAKQKTIKVKTAEQFLNAINSDTRIIVENDLLDLTEALNNIDSYDEKKTDNVGAYSISEYDGLSLVVCNIKNLSIEGKKADIHLQVKPRYADVFKFISCKGISLKNLKMGHTQAGDCTGNVLTLSHVSDLNITDCKLYGCGVIGIEAEYCENIKISNSEIYECSQSSFFITTSNNFTFDGCKIHDNGGRFDIINCKNMVFNNCSFTNNRNSFCFVDSNSSATMNNCKINHEGGKGAANITFNNCEAEFGEDCEDNYEEEDYEDNKDEDDDYDGQTSPWDNAKEELTFDDMLTADQKIAFLSDEDRELLSYRYYSKAIALAKRHLNDADNKDTKIAFELLSGEPVKLKASELFACKKVRSIQLNKFGTVIYNYFSCKFFKEDINTIFHKTAGSQRKWGYLYRFDDRYIAFSGCYYYGDNTPTYFKDERFLQIGLMKKTSSGKILMLLLKGEDFELLEFSK